MTESAYPVKASMASGICMVGVHLCAGVLSALSLACLNGMMGGGMHNIFAVYGVAAGAVPAFTCDVSL